ncbi:hypothetical protein SAMN05216267_101594 [Actinacidiphila rubida]|uniref:Uncharacterized protein n=1 Tax=Actinacidiphila rubida TaxID=310780 RepID=A0A1H8L8H8_9ACTN|nr:hypothetical protein SAMN05216267_101594 [Actinacidiphila rubida]
MSAEDLTEHLRRLRVRAGNPSVRELERLTEQQGPRRRLSSSTIHDKLNGKSPLKLPQLLALVQACADYARAHGISLSSEDLDQALWRGRLEPTQAPATVEVATPAPPFIPVPSFLVEKPDLSPPEWLWNLPPEIIEPLRNAGMDDVVELIEGRSGKPLTEWLPQVFSALSTAGMAYTPFVQWASEKPVRELVPLIEAVGDNKDDPVLTSLLYWVSKNQSAEKLPSLVVALRRAAEEYFDGHDLAQRLISFISGKDVGVYIRGLRKDCVPVVNAFRSATLLNDSNRIVREIGRYRTAVVIRLVGEFGGPGTPDGDAVLAAVGKGSDYHIAEVLRELRTSRFSSEVKRHHLVRIVFGVAPERRLLTADELGRRGLQEESQVFRDMKDVPPF